MAPQPAHLRGRAVWADLFSDSFCRLDNRSRSDAKMIDEFVRLSAVWDRANGEFMYSDTFRTDCTQHSIPETAVGVMIFNGKDAPLRGLGAVQQRGTVDGDDTIEIDDTHGDACCFQCVVGLQGFKERDASRDNRENIRCALTNDFRSADVERFIRPVQN